MHKDLPSLSEQLLGPGYAEVPFDRALKILREKLDYPGKRGHREKGSGLLF